MRVLLVEDDPLYAEVLYDALEDAGYEVAQASDGYSALDALSNDLFQIVITDWSMPGMSGIDLCRRIRENQASGYVYIILVTGKSSEEDVVQGIASGADDFIRKPVNVDELIARLAAGERMLSAQMNGVVIFALAKLAESRDPETGLHLERVRNYAKLIGQNLHRNKAEPSVDARFVELIYQTTPLHDIGKVAIPDRILLKPDKLTSEEFEVMKTHTIAGAETLRAVRQKFPDARWLKMAEDIAACHHEKFDGNGYPFGIKGRDIPLEGRVMAIVDVYDALTSKRVYKPAWSHDDACKHIRSESNRHFDPMLVEAFVEEEERFRQVKESMGDAAEVGIQSVMTSSRNSEPLIVGAN